MKWHLKDIEDVVEQLGTSLKEGLSSDEARKRLSEYGPNELKEKKKKTPFMVFLDQFKDFLILVLIGAAIIAGIVGKPIDAAAILAIVVLSAIMGFIQERKAEKAMAALKEMAAPTALVLRNGIPQNIPASEIVPGDVVLLEAGNIVPADIRLTESANLKVEEAALTGESVPVEKHTKHLHDAHLPIGDRKNIAYKGTIVTYGRGAGIVVETAMNTEMGKIAAMLQKAEDTKTPLQLRLADFGKKLTIVILVVCATIFAAGLMRGEDIILMFLTAIALAVAAIPEALPAVITITLAIGAKKMVEKNALIRKLPAVETLGSVTYICSDKTGTLTLNKMTVEEMYVDERLVVGGVDLRVYPKENGEHIKDAGRHIGIGLPPGLPLLMTALALSNDAQMDAKGNIIGDPTEIALYSIAKNNGFSKKEVEKELPRVAELPFDSDRKCMTTFHKIPPTSFLAKGDSIMFPTLAKGGEGGFISFTKGAVDVMLENADNIVTSNGLIPLNMQEIHMINNRMAADGLRVLCIAMRTWDALPDDMSPENVENRLTIIGLTGLMDPPREEAKEAIAICKAAGIKPTMITGDHPITANAIAKRLGLVEDGAKNTITGRELDKLSMEEFEEKVEDVRVYARVAPDHKFKIVKALQDKGQFVAMTGDGVNDAPALKQADIGVAMGITGTAVSKEASSMILLDDNFATIVKAVEEGRRIYDNILKFLKYSLTANAGSVWAIFLAPFFGLPLPMLPLQILWMNLLCDGLPGFSLTADPAEKGVMSRPPRHPNEGVFAGGRGEFILVYGFARGIILLLFQAYLIEVGVEAWQTMVFTAFVLGRMSIVVSVRHATDSLFKTGFFTNKMMALAVVGMTALQLMVVYVPFFHPIFHTVPLTFSELMLTFAIAASMFFVIEIGKLIKRWQIRKNAIKGLTG